MCRITIYLFKKTKVKALKGVSRQRGNRQRTLLNMHTYTHTHTHTLIHTHTHIHTYTHLYTLIHTYTHTHIYTLIHTYTHIKVRLSLLGNVIFLLDTCSDIHVSRVTRMRLPQVSRSFQPYCEPMPEKISLLWLNFFLF